jgi:choline-sulfatase
MARPNLLYLLSDQHARHVLGCYGDKLVRTPNLDRLAASGVVFDNAYCPSPICVPSRMSMLTAQHPSAQECWTNDDFLASDRPTWLHALGAAGYRPHLAGRLHAMGPDQMHGYVTRNVGDHSSNYAGIPRHDMGPLHQTNDPWRASLEVSGPGQSAYQVKDADTVDAACAQLERIAAARRDGSDDPFCLSVGLMLPHPPYVAWPEDYALYAGRIPPAGLPAPPVGQEHPWLAWWRSDRGIADVDQASSLRARAAYWGLVTRLDHMIGRILATLDRLGLGENTLVAYTSDHGDQLGERGLWWKHTFYEESVSVPLILSWPGHLPAGARRKQVVNLIDATATILDALGAAPLPHAQGRSFLEVARNAAAPWEDETFSEYCTDAVPAWTGGMAVRQRMIRSGPWKLIYYHGYRPQLFDLASDPHELRDLAESPSHRDVRARLEARLLADWDPEAIAARMRERRLDKNVVAAWARNVSPDDQHRWHILPEQNRIDGTSPSGGA